MTIHCFQHVAFESPGTIKEWASANGHTITYTYFYEPNYTIPAHDKTDALLVLGGYMNVDEEKKFPWLKEEKQFIKEFITSGKKVIGICLGSQLIASALGCKVYAAKEKEIGFFDISFTKQALTNPLFNHFQNPYPVFHWHGDTFDLPNKALLIASTNTCMHQAFVIGNQVLGLQFHLEMNGVVLSDMLLHDGAELKEPGMFIQNIDAIKNNALILNKSKFDLFLLLDKFFEQ